MYIDYKLITHDPVMETYRDFEAKVLEALRHGWVLHGPTQMVTVLSTINPGHSNTQYSQAVTKRVDGPVSPTLLTESTPAGPIC